jgi:hypothetical protein
VIALAQGFCLAALLWLAIARPLTTNARALPFATGTPGTANLISVMLIPSPLA